MKLRRVHRSHRQMQFMPEQIHDPYHQYLKPAEPTACPDCGAVFAGGRWRWSKPPAAAHKMRCPACRRTHDRFPAGKLHIAGPWARERRTELLNLVRNHAHHVRSEHPLQRIMDITEADEEVSITTTDHHLARGLGQALHHAYQGCLDFRMAEGAAAIDVRWTR